MVAASLVLTLPGTGSRANTTTAHAAAAAPGGPSPLLLLVPLQSRPFIGSEVFRGLELHWPSCFRLQWHLLQRPGVYLLWMLSDT